MSSAEAGRIVARAVHEYSPKSKTTIKNFADGGEGTVQAILENYEYTEHKVETVGANGIPIVASWFFLKEEQIALFEMASVVGLPLLTVEDLNPEKTSTLGIAPIILDILNKKVKKVWLAAGGTSTLDAGLGLLKGMGVRFKNKEYPKNLIEIKGSEVLDFSKVETSNKNIQLYPDKGNCLFPSVIFDIIADVHAPLLGSKGAVFAFGKQKGATPKNTALLERGMVNFSNVIQGKTKDPSFLKLGGLGAAGGIALGLSLLFKVNIKKGADFIVAKTGINKTIDNCDILITGEGQFNSQSKQGKGPWVLASLAKERNIPALIISGLKMRKEDKVGDFHFLETSNSSPKSKTEAKENLFNATTKWLKENEVNNNETK